MVHADRLRRCVDGRAVRRRLAGVRGRRHRDGRVARRRHVDRWVRQPATLQGADDTEVRRLVAEPD